MCLIGTIVFILCSFAGKIHCETSMETVSVDSNLYCKPNETECPWGCCPYTEAVCCLDYYCCEQFHACVPPQICIGAVNNNGQISLTSKKAARITGSVSKCPLGMTECAPNKCCVHEHGVCCPDGNNCCPHGYRCDIPNKKCIRNTATTDEIDRHVYNDSVFDNSLREMNEMSSYKSCPGGNLICSNHMNCCINDKGEWDCCPNPVGNSAEVKQTGRRERIGDYDCCLTLYGDECCIKSTF